MTKLIHNLKNLRIIQGHIGYKVFAWSTNMYIMLL